LVTQRRNGRNEINTLGHWDPRLAGEMSISDNPLVLRRVRCVRRV